VSNKRQRAQGEAWEMGRREQSADKDDTVRQTFILQFPSAVILTCPALFRPVET
jgi:hypothetical protein